MPVNRLTRGVLGDEADVLLHRSARSRRVCPSGCTRTIDQGSVHSHLAPIASLAIDLSKSKDCGSVRWSGSLGLAVILSGSSASLPLGFSILYAIKTLSLFSLGLYVQTESPFVVALQLSSCFLPSQKANAGFSGRVTRISITVMNIRPVLDPSIQPVDADPHLLGWSNC